MNNIHKKTMLYVFTPILLIYAFFFIMVNVPNISSIMVFSALGSIVVGVVYRFVYKHFEQK